MTVTGIQLQRTNFVDEIARVYDACRRHGQTEAAGALMALSWFPFAEKVFPDPKPDPVPRVVKDPSPTPEAEVDWIGSKRWEFRVVDGVLQASLQGDRPTKAWWPQGELYLVNTPFKETFERKAIWAALLADPNVPAT